MVTHARNALSTVRRPTAVVSARARARESAKEKKEEEKRERKEEVRRLKALKRKEVEAKLLKLVEAAGEGTAGLEALDLEGDWDPEEHDRKMAEVYGQEYGEIEVSLRRGRG
jgi:protein KRI1